MLKMDPQGLSIPSKSRMKTTHLGSSSYYLAIPFQQKLLYSRHYSFEQRTPLWGEPSVIAEWRTRIQWSFLRRWGLPKLYWSRSLPPVVVQIPLSSVSLCCPQILSHIIHTFHLTIDAWKSENTKAKILGFGTDGETLSHKCTTHRPRNITSSLRFLSQLTEFFFTPFKTESLQLRDGVCCISAAHAWANLLPRVSAETLDKWGERRYFFLKK